MDLTALALYDQALLCLAALLMFSAIWLLAIGRVFTLVAVFAFQGGLLGATAAVVAYSTAQPHLYISAALALGLKAVVIPWMLRRLVRQLGMRHEVAVHGHPVLILVVGGALVVFSYYVALPIVELATTTGRNTIGISLAIVLLSMLLMITRSQAVAQVVGFMAMENGLFFAAVVATSGMPLVVELGVAFDILVAAILFGVFFLQLRETIDDFDVDRLSRLTEELPS